MEMLRQFFALLMLSVFASGSLAQLTIRAPGSLDSQTLGAPVPLTQEQAFPFYVSETGINQLRISWNLAPEHYLYRHAFGFSLLQPGNEPLTLSPTLPDGIKKTDEFFGAIEAYYDQVNADLQLPANVGADTVLLIEYQGCADWGFCYPPQRREFNLNP